MPRYSSEEIETVRANLFEAAHQAIPDWQTFPWHLDRQGRIQTVKVNSSQALAIDVFGAIATHSDSVRILNALAEKAGIAPQGSWHVDLEWEDEDNFLNEKRRTQVDVRLRAPDAEILVECKFTETGGGCSQINLKKLNDGSRVRQCTGRYEPQVNPVNGEYSNCALSGKGIRYWDFVPSVFSYSSDAAYDPCPFRKDAFQWMRNLVLAQARAENTGKQVAVLVAYANEPSLPLPKKLSKEPLVPDLKDAGLLKPISYQEIIELVAEVSDDPVWRELRAWVTEKIKAASQPAN